MNKIEKENIMRALVSRCAEQMKYSGVDNDKEHKRIIDAHYAQIKPLGVTRIEFMIEIGRHTGALKNWHEIYC